MFRKILVAFDGSLYSRRALRLACELAKVYGSKVSVIYVIPDTSPLQEPKSGLPKPEKGYLEFLKAQGKVIIEGAKQLAKEYGIHVDTEILEGHPVEKICWCAKKGRFDLIIMGKRGTNAMRRLGMGSNSERVARACDENVLIVR